MIIIDGSEGEGGGQVVRTACALSLVTGEPFRIANVRGGRDRPGLMRQHVTAIEAACAIGTATCEGLSVGSSEIAFRPGRIVPGEYQFAVGTAGSTALVLQTVLMPLLRADGPSRLVLEGGTHNPQAPPFEFLARAFLPILNHMGPKVCLRLVRHGFYPRGGGRIEVDITPAPLEPIACRERGAPAGCSARVLLAGLPLSIGERMMTAARKGLVDWPAPAFAIDELPADLGPGIVLLLERAFDHVTEVMSGFGRMGERAEAVAGTAARRIAGYAASGAFAGPYLADQLLLPMALAGGGSFTTVTPSKHSRTAASIIERFLGRRWSFTEDGEAGHRAELV
ncbi:MAG: RNA 3'-terminal phosphate cyclase [Alphaproteobacteria bacterium]|nr:RNA 3'-terminal phosphate cyclase [Alphaproteobacteria bacterium]